MNDSLLHVYGSPHPPSPASQSGASGSHLKWTSLQNGCSTHTVGEARGGEVLADVSSCPDVPSNLTETVSGRLADHEDVPGHLGEAVSRRVAADVPRKLAVVGDTARGEMENGWRLDSDDREGIDAVATTDAVILSSHMMSVNPELQGVAKTPSTDAVTPNVGQTAVQSNAEVPVLDDSVKSCMEVVTAPLTRGGGEGVGVVAHVASGSGKAGGVAGHVTGKGGGVAGHVTGGSGEGGSVRERQDPGNKPTKPVVRVESASYIASQYISLVFCFRCQS